MTWVRIDENFPEHPKVAAAGDDAAWLFVCALAYCNRQLTDGFVPSAAIRRLTSHSRPIVLAVKLIEVGLLERDEERGGFVVHDFLQYQPSKASVEEDRRKARERMAKARRSAADVRPNKPGTSDNPVRSGPSRSVTSQSSVRSGKGTNGHRPDDDDQFMKTISILVEHKAREHPPRSRRAWEATTIPATIAEDGPQVRAHLAAECDPVTAAGLILGSQAAAELAAGRL